MIKKEQLGMCVRVCVGQPIKLKWANKRIGIIGINEVKVKKGKLTFSGAKRKAINVEFHDVVAGRLCVEKHEYKGHS